MPHNLGSVMSNEALQPSGCAAMRSSFIQLFSAPQQIAKHRLVQRKSYLFEAGRHNKYLPRFHDVWLHYNVGVESSSCFFVLFEGIGESNGSLFGVGFSYVKYQPVRQYKWESEALSTNIAIPHLELKETCKLRKDFYREGSTFSNSQVRNNSLV